MDNSLNLAHKHTNQEAQAAAGIFVMLSRVYVYTVVEPKYIWACHFGQVHLIVGFDQYDESGAGHRWGTVLAQ